MKKERFPISGKRSFCLAQKNAGVIAQIEMQSSSPRLMYLCGTVLLNAVAFLEYVFLAA